LKNSSVVEFHFNAFNAALTSSIFQFHIAQISLLKLFFLYIAASSILDALANSSLEVAYKLFLKLLSIHFRLFIVSLSRLGSPQLHH
jgi:hypothetical protein